MQPTKLKVWRDKIIWIELIIASILLVVITSSVFLQVIFRYVLEQPLSAAEELARFCFVWVSLLGAAATISASSSQGIDLLVKKFPERIQRVIAVLSSLGILLFCGMLVVKGMELVSIVYSQRSPGLNLPMSYVYISVPVSALLIAITLGLEWFEQIGMVVSERRREDGHSSIVR